MRALASVVTAAALLFSFMAAAGAPAKPEAKDPGKEFVRKQHAQRYSLRQLGMTGLTCDVEPKWEIVAPDANADGLRLLRQIHFALKIDESGRVTVTHRTDKEIPDDARAGYDQIFSGMEQFMSGFYATWSLFMVNDAYPEVESAFEFHDGDAPTLAWKEGDTSVLALFGKDAILTDLRTESPEAKASIRPKFHRTKAGLVLDGYQGDYVPTSGTGVTKLDVSVEYKEVDGLLVPSVISARSSVDGAPSTIATRLENHRVTKRH